MSIVGLPSKSVDEARERIRSAIRNSNSNFPPKRITITLAPSDINKTGTGYDLAIAIGLLQATQHTPPTHASRQHHIKSPYYPT